jgi:CHAD domain-containing protein
MKDSSPAVAQFLDEYGKRCDSVSRTLRVYLGDPGSTQTHGLRAAVRRLDAAIKVLPKSTRKEKAVRRCHERCRDLLRQTSRIRDIDIILATIAAHSDDATVSLMLNNLQEERDEFVDNSTKAAWRLFEHPPPKLARRDLPRFARRVETVLRALDVEIGRELQVSVADETKVEELHSLRKDCKRLRYTLELLPSVEGHSRQILFMRRWQDLLGEIRDLDVILEYLSRARSSPVVKAVVASERARRHARYAAFVRLSRKKPRPWVLRLGGSADGTVAPR